MPLFEDGSITHSTPFERIPSHAVNITTVYSRMLYLQPAQARASLLEVVLEEMSLDDDHLEYEALSYVWGARTGSIPVRCCDRTLLVTPNCESALRHLHLSTSSRALWIDAICIDQSNERISRKERGHQITQTDDVYSHTRQTLC